MISKKDMEKQFNKIYSLTNRSIPDVNNPEIYFNKLQKYKLEDFISACNDDDALEEITRFGFNWPVLKKHIERMKATRLRDVQPEEGKRFNMNKIPDSLRAEIAKIKGFSNDN